MSEFRRNRSKEQDKISAMQTDENVPAGEATAQEMPESSSTRYVHDEYDDYSPWDN